MKKCNSFMWLVIVAVFAGCASTEELYKSGERPRLLKQASFDLNCPVSKLKDTPLSNYYNIGVEGCGKRAKYKYIDGAGWVANTISR